MRTSIQDEASDVPARSLALFVPPVSLTRLESGECAALDVATRRTVASFVR